MAPPRSVDLRVDRCDSELSWLRMVWTDSMMTGRYIKTMPIIINSYQIHNPIQWVYSRQFAWFSSLQTPIQGNWDIWHISHVSANYICTEHKAMLAPGHQSKLLLALQESKRPNWRRHRVCLHRLRCSVASIFTYFHGPWFALQPQRKRRLNRTSSEWEESPCSPAQKINIYI